MQSGAQAKRILLHNEPKVLTDQLRLEEEGASTHWEVKLETAIIGLFHSSLCKLCFKAPSLGICRW